MDESVARSSRGDPHGLGIAATDGGRRRSVTRCDVDCLRDLRFGVSTRRPGRGAKLMKFIRIAFVLMMVATFVIASMIATTAVYAWARRSTPWPTSIDAIAIQTVEVAPDTFVQIHGSPVLRVWQDYSLKAG